MFNKIVTYHIHNNKPLPAFDALAYQYIMAGNGVFIRAKNQFFSVLMPIAPCPVRGLEPLAFNFHLKAPRLPAFLLTAILTDARRARRANGSLNEVLYQICHQGEAIQVKKPAQRVTASSVEAANASAANVICELHSHGEMPAFFSQTDDQDEQGIGLYAVMGKIESKPEIRLRVGCYGYWYPLPITTLFAGNPDFIDLHKQKS